MIRKVFTMQVYPDKVAEYIQRHNPVWPEMVEMLKAHGVNNYSLFLAEDGTTLFGYAEIEAEDRWLAIGETDVCQRWWVEMASLMRTNDDNSPESKPLRQIFHLP
ncbi:L-rhamnose mutarotase [Neolewinella lacunae]|uniref:L-rhamnose mutarotase n=1 Tax=Neolewinella lacunae TaxID=1517758 RepID=A0A923PNB8_9BACT|nr:L-rhamnose mutarotase [Neolewinella lacunae]MBC6996614.1 L-rhamnose mutarotase [Neolewinella lacunae]MDN3634822.1 L-rhamnose mutarotase [Neolewinella lacunae]